MTDMPALEEVLTKFDDSCGESPTELSAAARQDIAALRERLRLAEERIKQASYLLEAGGGKILEELHAARAVVEAAANYRLASSGPVYSESQLDEKIMTYRRAIGRGG